MGVYVAQIVYVHSVLFLERCCWWTCVPWKDVASPDGLQIMFHMAQRNLGRSLLRESQGPLRGSSQAWEV